MYFGGKRCIQDFSGEKLREGNHFEKWLGEGMDWIDLA
jgi:hypothetical protein